MREFHGEFDEIYSKGYDLSDEGFAMRNRSWKDFPEGWWKERIKDVKEFHAGIMAIRKEKELEDRVSLDKVIEGVL